MSTHRRSSVGGTAHLVAACTLFAVVAGLPCAARAQPTFELSWHCPECPSTNRFVRYPFDRARVEVASVLSTNGLAAGADGAHGWTLSIAADGCRIASATTGALSTLPETAAALSDETGYAKVDYSYEGEPGSACEGLSGVIAAVVLSVTQAVSLEPTEVHPLLNMAIRVDVPPQIEGCAPCRLFYADGCSAEGITATNLIEYGDASIPPTVNSLDLEFCPQEDCTDEPLNVMVQAEPLAAPGHSSTPYDGLLGTSINEDAEIEVSTPLGWTPAATFCAAIVSQNLSEGVQAWSFSIDVEGDLLPVDITVEGTAAEVALEDDGFLTMEAVDPELLDLDGVAQGHGFVCSAVLNFRDPVTLPPTGTATVLQATLAADTPQGESPLASVVNWIDGLRGSASYVPNRLTVGDDTVLACRYQTLRVRSLPSFVSSLRRCDPNDDGTSDIADAIWIVNDLFAEGPPTHCRESADCNDDGSVDLSDAVFSIGFQFQGTSAPPAPYPECGTDPDATPESCPAGAVTGCQ